ncbi:DoxX family protein [Mycobacterium sp. SMC-4]|uniref:DoxX family protein n=1 Tax=Mycobacterium sp. SMC-4 TaxID=2857059 RepID=UPI0021B18DD5|nr:DoxX family protein [Mycobacterium sp. SMC-4]UXA20279.1 DoxX family protein [Mycobacterium sp. SMC-4]
MALNSARTYAALAAFQAVDAAACVGPVEPVAEALRTVALPKKVWPVLPVVKAASALGLLSVFRYPGLARLTTLLLTVYFALAASSHVRVKDWSPGLVASSVFLTLYGTLTVKGPPVS